nr:tonB-system energizer ExbB [Rosenbergiella epipactidis]
MSVVTNNLMQADLSVLGMYQHADIVVKVVMIGLLLASVATWAIFFAKYTELSAAKRRLKADQQALKDARTLDGAGKIAQQFAKNSHAALLVAEALDERVLSAQSDDQAGIKERTVFRLERQVARIGRHASRNNGFLATIGSVSPFIGLFGTVWGIMNSFIGIAKTQTTNLAVVAPGIAEALLATAVGLVAAIPAVVIYNVFARMIAGYKASLGDSAAQIILLQSRDADLQNSRYTPMTQNTATQKLRVG